MLCDRCRVVMKSGTTYEQRNGRGSSRRYDECPMCHEKRYNKASNFHEVLHLVTQRQLNR